MSDCLHRCRVEVIEAHDRINRNNRNNRNDGIDRIDRAQPGEADPETLPDLLRVAAQADPRETLFYWERPENGEAMLGIGCAHDVRTAGRDRLEDANREALATLAKVEVERDPDWKPEVTVIYTPNLEAKGFPKDRLIAVDLENYVTRVFNSDYFGESKKGGLRMWNDEQEYDPGKLMRKVAPAAH